MNNNPKVSIIVPVYNVEKYLRECLDSLVNQTYTNIEIVLVDDESKDSSGDICDEYAEKEPRIKVIHQVNGGPSNAWKSGFFISTGAYVMFVDSDDYIEKTMIDEMIEKVTGNDKEMVLSDYVINRDYDSKIGDTYVYQGLKPGEYSRKQIEQDIIPNLFGNENRLVSYSRCMKLISRRLIANNIDYCDERILMGDDSTIILPAIIDAERIFMMDHKVYYHYRYLRDSVVHRYDTHAFENNKIYYQVIREMLKSKIKDADLLKDELNNFDKEEIFLLLLVIKNEARGNIKNCDKTIKNIANDVFVKNIVKNNVKVKSLSNKLIYNALVNSNLINIGILKLAMKIYYR